MAAIMIYVMSAIGAKERRSSSSQALKMDGLKIRIAPCVKCGISQNLSFVSRVARRRPPLNFTLRGLYEMPSIKS